MRSNKKKILKTWYSRSPSEFLFDYSLPMTVCLLVLNRCIMCIINKKDFLKGYVFGQKKQLMLCIPHVNPLKRLYIVIVLVLLVSVTLMCHLEHTKSPIGLCASFSNFLIKGAYISKYLFLVKGVVNIKYNLRAVKSSWVINIFYCKLIAER